MTIRELIAAIIRGIGDVSEAVSEALQIVWERFLDTDLRMIGAVVVGLIALGIGYFVISLVLAGLRTAIEATFNVDRMYRFGQGVKRFLSRKSN